MHLRRLAILFVISVLGSSAIAVLSPAMFPQAAPVMMADPGFDAAAFYDSRMPNRVSRDSGRAQLPGQAAAQAPDQPAQKLPPGPILSLNQVQTNNAYIVVEVGRQLKLPRRALVVAMATAMQETFLRNLANPDVPASLKYPNDGKASDADSIGVFQQRPSMGWGTVAQLMDPAESAARFYARLVKITNWQGLSVAGAAQAVQRSAFPTAYAKHVPLAEKIVDAL